MAYATQRVERRQSYCPDCQTTRGTAIQITAERDRLVITYQCAECGKQWDVYRAPPVTLTFQAPLEDRALTRPLLTNRP